MKRTVGFAASAFVGIMGAMIVSSTVVWADASTATNPATNPFANVSNQFVLAQVPHHAKEEVWLSGNTVYATSGEATHYAPLFIEEDGVAVETFVPKAVADWYKEFPEEVKLSDYIKGDYEYAAIQKMVPSTHGVAFGEIAQSRELGQIFAYYKAKKSA